MTNRRQAISPPRRSGRTWLVMIVGALAAGTSGAAAETARVAAFQPTAALRRPIALVAAADGAWLYVANRRSGTVSVVEVAERRVVDEQAVGRQLADLKATPDGRRLLAVDKAAHELIVLDVAGPRLALSQRIGVAPYPVSVVLTADGSQAWVASLWSRRLSLVSLARAPRVMATLPLPFAPRELLLVGQGGKLLAADAFGGRLAVVNVASRQVERIHALSAHNIRGMALSPDGTRLAMAHQILDGQAETNQPNIHWGALLTDVLRWVSLDELLSPDGRAPFGGHVHQYSDIDGAGGDPAGVAISADGVAVTALAGVGRLAIGPEWSEDRVRLDAGVRPTAVVLDPTGRRAFVTDTLGDTVFLVDLERAAVAAAIGLGPQPDLTAADRGELLFYDARLSLDGWYSCHSCHTDGHTNGLTTDNLGDGSFGAPKRVLSLLGTGETAPWAWNGSLRELEAQIRKSIASTMQGSGIGDEDVRSLAAYLRSLPPPPALGPLSSDYDAAAVERGRVVFERQACTDCHAPPHYTSAGNYDVGLRDERGQSQFNPPSLRGVSQRGPYFHDNRAATLEQVFDEFRHQLRGPATADELRDLIRYLRSL